MDEASEWGDFELLLRTLTEIHAQPLLMSVPIDGPFYDVAGVSRSARQAYYDQMQALARRYHFVLVNFQEHDEDRCFRSPKPANTACSFERQRLDVLQSGSR
jgi:D-alanine transfer protein